MNMPFDAPKPVAVSPMQTELASLTPPPLPFPGENLEQYQRMRQAVLAESRE